MSRKMNFKRWALAGGLGLALAASTGCYERTIRADGMGASGVSIQQPYVKNRWGASKKSEFQPMKIKPSHKSSNPW